MIAQMPSDIKSTVLFKKTWHKGVIGIVASRCIEHYYRPTIILTESNGKATGSARSVDGFDVHSAINECEELLQQFGGHKYAAGLTLEIDKIEAFQEKFEKVVAERILPEQLIPSVKIDSEIELKEINFKTNNILCGSNGAIWSSKPRSNIWHEKCLCKSQTENYERCPHQGFLA